MNIWLIIGISIVILVATIIVIWRRMENGKEKPLSSLQARRVAPPSNEHSARLPGDSTVDAPPPDGDVKKKKRK